MALVLFLLSFASLLLLLLGMIKPRLVVRWGQKRSRGRVLLFYGLSMIVCFVWFLAIIPPVPNTAKESLAASAPENSTDTSKAEDTKKEDSPKVSPTTDNIQSNPDPATKSNKVQYKLPNPKFYGLDTGVDSYYEGEVNAKNLPNGEGKITYKIPNNKKQYDTLTFYEGHFSNGLYDGKGTLYSFGADKIEFSGIFNNGEKVFYPFDNEFYYNQITEPHTIKFHGDPAQTKAGSSMKVYYVGGNTYYEGEWKNNQINGKGTIYFLNGKPNEIGTFENGKLTGKGKIYNEKGDWEEGTFSEGKLDGKAKIYFASGKLSVEGKFKNDKLVGDYKEYYENGNLKSEGTYDEGWLKEYGRYGYGVDYYENGKPKYKGEFSNSQYDGSGTLFNENGDVIQKGKWKNGKFVQ